MNFWSRTTIASIALAVQAATALPAGAADVVVPADTVVQAPAAPRRSDSLALRPSDPAVGGEKSRKKRRGEPVFMGPRRLCPDRLADPACTHTSLAEALKDVPDGETVTLAPGVYQEGAVVSANNLTIAAEPGARLLGQAARGKAALVIRGDNTLITGLECSHITVRDNNGACIRLEGRNLTLRNVFFHHSQMGILTGNNKGEVVIEDSRFENMTGGKRVLGHAVYIGATELFVFRGNKVLRTGGQGHAIKTRALKSVIENNVIASLDSNQSRVIDAPDGGEIVIRNNIIEQGPQADNNDLIAIAMERPKAPSHSTLIEGNTVLCDRPRCTFVNSRSPGPVIARGNRMIGPAALTGPLQYFLITADENESLADRAAAGLRAFPALPESN